MLVVHVIHICWEEEKKVGGRLHGCITDETMTSVNASRSKGLSSENQASDRLDRGPSQPE
jgi:hypothetical protein